MTNRVEHSIEGTRKLLMNKPAIELDKIYRELDMSFEEWFNLQELKSLAQVQGWITVDEAVTIYQILGSTNFHFNSQPLAEKVVITQIHHQLLLKKVGKGSHLK